MKDQKILVWDIESTGLNATFGTILCIGYKWHGKPRVWVPSIFDYEHKGTLDDQPLVEAFVKVYEQADYTVAHFGTYFDLPMIKTKLLRYGLPPLPPKPLMDTWKPARKQLRLHNNRLATLAEYLGTDAQKTPILFDQWLAAAHGSEAAMKYVKKHCRLDVLALGQVFEKLRPLFNMEPTRQLFLPGDHEGEHTCVSCGSPRLHKRGWHVAKTRKYQRYQCQACGKWQRDIPSEKAGRIGIVGL